MWGLLMSRQQGDRPCTRSVAPSTGSSRLRSSRAANGAAARPTTSASCGRARPPSQRLTTDRHYFARPSRTLFNDIRTYFPMSAQLHVYRVVDRYMTFAGRYLATRPSAVMELTGRRQDCRATTRKGTPCQRVPLPSNGYCPSHQHLAETEEVRPGGLSVAQAHYASAATSERRRSVVACGSASSGWESWARAWPRTCAAPASTSRSGTAPRETARAWSETNGGARRRLARATPRSRRRRGHHHGRRRRPGGGGAAR